MRVDGNLGSTLSYHPNSAGLWKDQPKFAEPMLPIEGAAGHWDHRVDEDYWEQPGILFRKMNPKQKQALFDNTARAMRGTARHIQERHIVNCIKADPAYGAGVAESLGRLE
jgi:catalase